MKASTAKRLSKKAKTVKKLPNNVNVLIAFYLEKIKTAASYGFNEFRTVGGFLYLEEQQYLEKLGYNVNGNNPDRCDNIITISWK